MSKKVAARRQSALVRAVLMTLSAEIARNRKRRGFSQEDLAQRIGCSRNTLRAIEAGRPTVEIGLFLEAATVLDIPLLGGDDRDIRLRGDSARREAELLPQPRSVTEIFDDF